MKIMKVRLSMWLCFGLASAVGASAVPIQFSSGPGNTSGMMAPGEPWQYNGLGTSQNNEDNWGSPGPGSVQWAGSTSVTSFEIIFDLPTEVAIDLGTSQSGSRFGVVGIINHWIPTLINANAILFTDPVGESALNNTESYFVDIFFTGNGKVTDSAFSGAWDPAAGTTSPEPASSLLLAAGLLGIGGWLRRRHRAS